MIALSLAVTLFLETIKLLILNYLVDNKTEEEFDEVATDEKFIPEPAKW